MDIHPNKFQKIIKILEKKRNFKVLSQFGKDYGDQQIIAVQNNNGEENLIKIYSLFDGFESTCQEKLNLIKQESLILKSFNHPNIIKFIDEFQTDYTYFIQFEKYPMTLYDYILKQKSIDEKIFVDIALQLIKTIQFLHDQNFVIRELNLKNIFIDQANKIKLYNFTLKEHSYYQILKSYFQSNNKEEMLICSNEMFEIQNLIQKKLESSYSKEKIIWEFGMCMYRLAGASLNHILQFVVGNESYQIQNQLNKYINQILLKILNKNPKSRPSIEEIIHLFENVLTNSNSYEINSLLLNNENLIRRDAEELLSSFKFQEAIFCLNCLIQIKQDNSEYLAMIGLAYLEIGNLQLSKQYSLKSIELNQNNDLSLSNLGFIYYQENKLIKALEFIQKSLNINPKNYRALTYKSYVFSSKNENKNSIELCNFVISLNPKYPHVFNSISLIYYNIKQYDKCELYYKKALEINPNFFIALNSLGTISFEKKLYKEAEIYYLKALEKNSNYEYSYYNLGITYQQQKQYLKAQQYYKKAIEINSDYTKAYYQLGSISLKQKQYSLAEYYFKEALKTNPNSESILLDIGNLYKRRKMLQQAEDYYQSALVINPSNNKTKQKLNKINQKCTIF